MNRISNFYKSLIFTLSLFCISCSLIAQNSNVFSIVTCPAEDSNSNMNVSWGADTSCRDTYLIYTMVKDVNWKAAKKVYPVVFTCFTYDSIYSKTADNLDFYENAIFLKCNASLTNLNSGSEYMYKIISDDNTESSVHYFKTGSKEGWSACVISDFHTYSPIPSRLEGAMKMVDTIKKFASNIDFVLHLGDVCAWGGSYSFWKELYREDNFNKYMWAGVNGNHDNMTRQYGLSNKFFRDANFNPNNSYGDEQGVSYFFKYGEVLFIMLNSESMRDRNGFLDAKNWLTKVVKENKCRYTIVCEHYQWFFGTDGKSSQYLMWAELFDTLGVDLALAGNDHIYVRSGAIYKNKKTDGSIGTIYIQAPSSDNGRGRECDYKLAPKYNNDLIMSRWSEGPKTIGALHLKVTKKKIIITLLDRNANVIDSGEVLSKRP